MTRSARTVPGRVSVVVPTRDSARTLRQCLASVTAQTHPDIELVVVDNGSRDGTVAIARELADRVEQWGPERSAQRNRGLRVSSGEYLVFLDSDQTLEPAVAAEAVALFATDPRLGAIVIPELARGQGFLASCRALEKHVYLGNPHVEAARVFRRDVLERFGGYDERLTGAEDWELPDRVEAARYRIGRTRARVWHEEGAVRIGEAFRKKRYYGRGVASYLQLPGGPGHRRLACLGLLRRPRLLARAPHHALGLAALKAVEYAGLALGLLEGRRGMAR